MLTKLWFIPALLLLAPTPVMAQSDDFCNRLIEERIKPGLKEVDGLINDLSESVARYKKHRDEYIRRQRASGCYAFDHMNKEIEALCKLLLDKQIVELEYLKNEIELLKGVISNSSEKVSNTWHASGCDAIDTPPSKPEPTVGSGSPSPGSQGGGSAPQSGHCHRDWQQHAHDGRPELENYWHQHRGNKCSIASLRNRP